MPPRRPRITSPPLHQRPDSPSLAPADGAADVARASGDEHAALRRVAALVARDVPAGEVFAAVAAEIGGIAGVALASVMRFEPDDRVTQIGVYGPDPIVLGSTWPLDGPSVVAAVRATARPARVDDYATTSSALAAASRAAGVTAGVGVPIVVAGEVWGVAVALSTSAPLPVDTESRLTRFTELAAAVIANAHAGDERRRLLDEHVRLRRIATLVARGAPSSDVFAAVAEAVAEVLPAPHVSVFRCDADGSVERVGGAGAADPCPIGARVRPRPGIVEAVVRDRRPARVDDDGDVAAAAREAGLRSAVGAPIVVDDAVWGVVVTTAGACDALPEDAETRLEGFTELLATAIASAQARGDLRALADEQAALRRVATLVAEGGGSRDVFDRICAETGRFLGATSVDLAELADDGGSRTLAGWAAADAGGPRATRSEAAAPVVVDGRPWGALTASFDAGDQAPPGAELRIAGFAGLVATAVSNTQNRLALEELVREQTALRRVATLVAEGAESRGVFDAICEETGLLLGATHVNLARFTPDERLLTMAGWSLRDTHVPVGTSLPIEEDTLDAAVRRSRKPGRVERYADESGRLASVLRARGVRSEVGAPVVVEGEVWGSLVGGWDSDVVPPAGIEHRLARFADLVATAVSNAQSRAGLGELAREQAALRRVATLVARRAPAAEVFAAVAEEVGRVLEAEVTDLWRYDDDGAVFVASWTSGPPLPFPGRLDLDGASVGRLVRETGRPARIDDHGSALARDPGAVTRAFVELGIVAAIGCPVVVDGRTWGVMSACRLGGPPFPSGAEHRLASFTELVGTAIANATTHASLLASRARLVTAADEARRRVGRDLHDGTQQQLVSIGLDLETLKLGLPADLGAVRGEIDRIRRSLDGAVDDVREIARGLHPAILSQAGLTAALRTLGRRSPVPVRVDVQLGGRLPPSAEIALYYVVAEALTNAAKHARASLVAVAVAATRDRVAARISDDGVGGARIEPGSGLAGIQDRVEALGGILRIASPSDGGTTIAIELPVAGAATEI